jgi:flagellar biosynthesis GTPase FlhF
MPERIRFDHEPRKHEQPRQNAEASRPQNNETTNTAAAEQTQANALKAAHEKAEKHSVESAETKKFLQESERKEPRQDQHVAPSLKENARKQSLRNIRRNLKPHDRTLSRIIHQPLVSAISEVTEKSVARPSALLAGGLFSLVSSAGVLFIAKYYGYEYNFLVGIVSFAGGFLAGLLIEGLARLFSRAK